jgi:hypothetical protein
MTSIFRIHSTTISLLFLGALLANFFLFKSALLGGILLIFFLGVLGSMAGHGLAPKDAAPLQWWKGVVIIISIIMLVGSLIYYTAAFTQSAAFALALLLIPLTHWIGSTRIPSWQSKFHDLFGEKRKKISKKVWGSFIIITLLLIVCFSFLAEATTTEAIRSPWLAIDSTFLLALFFLFLLLSSYFSYSSHSSILANTAASYLLEQV